MDLRGPMCTKSKSEKKYVLVVVDDFSRCSFVSFLREKSKTIKILKTFCIRIQVEKGRSVMRIRNDRETEFDNVDIDHFCEPKEILLELHFACIQLLDRNCMLNHMKKLCQTFL